MKGVAIIVIVAVLAIVSIMALSLYRITLNAQTIQSSVRDAQIVESINTVEFYKIALGQALIFSTYQASYEYINNYGHVVAPTSLRFENNEFPIFRFYDDVSGFPTSPRTNFNNMILEKLNEYVGTEDDSTGTFQNEIVKIPNYDSIVTTEIIDETKIPMNPKIKVEAISNEKLVTDNEKLIISDSASMIQNVEISTLGMMSVPKDNFIDSDLIQSVMVDGVNQLSLSRSHSEVSCGRISDENMFIAANSQSSSSVEMLLNQISENKASEIQDSIDLKNLPMTLETNIVETIGNVDITCGFSKSDVVCRTCTREVICPEVEGFSYDEFCTEEYDCEWEGTTSCSFKYYAAAKATFILTDDYSVYPVYDEIDKTNEMRNLELKFAIISCNEYSRSGCEII